MRNLARLLSFALLLPTPVAAQRVLCVDSNSPAQAEYEEVAAAVDDASDGDVILIAGGIYQGPVVIDGKSLTLLVDSQIGAAFLNGPVSPPAGPSDPVLTVRNLDASQRVLVRGLSFQQCPLVPAPIDTLVSDCDGLVLFEDCDFDDPAVCPPQKVERTLVVERSAGVALVRCSFFGRVPMEPPTIERTALYLEESDVSLYECSIAGGTGSCSFATGATLDAGTGVLVESGTLFLSGCDVTGGNGGLCFSPAPLMNGGDGIVLGAGSPTVEIFDSNVAGGNPGSGLSGVGAPGEPTRIQTGSITNLEGSAFDFVVAAPAEGMRGATYTGVPGAAFVALRAQEPFTPVPGPFVGRRMVPGGFTLPDHGRIRNSGSIQTLRPLPAVPSSAEAEVFLEQAFFLDAAGLVAGPPSILVVVAPRASFTGSPTAGVLPLKVRFRDTSSGALASWLWDFGDGGTSTLQNPDHVYAQSGTYTVSLTVSGPNGTDSETLVDYVTVNEPAVAAGFSGSPRSGFAPLAVDFTDASSGVLTSWAWDFGDGGTSTLQNPTHVYATPGDYAVSLTVTGTGGTDELVRTDYIHVDELPPPPIADFSAFPTSGSAPLFVDFLESSTGEIATWSWDFGDGTTSTLREPNYVYANPGTYTVSLTVTGPGGSDTLTRVDYIAATGSTPPGPGLHGR